MQTLKPFPAGILSLWTKRHDEPRMTAPIGFLILQDSKWYRDVKDSWHSGITLRVRRENAGLTQAQLAGMIGLAVSTDVVQ